MSLSINVIWNGKFNLPNQLSESVTHFHKPHITFVAGFWTIWKESNNIIKAKSNLITSTILLCVNDDNDFDPFTRPGTWWTEN
jgi:hypothetical protein